ncbi:MAG: hypothetical protein SX243_14290 [Acidobacteriota bacterium]|nr:hypothetical protein [Acidobacteriota bacterium]
MPEVNDKYRGTIEYHLAFSKLITAARCRGTVTYQELAMVLGLPLVGAYMGAETGHLLGEISEDEVLAGRPMLSAVAVNVQGHPGPGFFALAKQLGKLSEDGDESAFWREELKSAHRTWAERLDRYAHPGRDA